MRARFFFTLGILLYLGTSLSLAHRDPTQPPGDFYRLKLQEHSIKLQAIYYNKQQPTVLINGKFYHEGDKILDALIVSIQKHRILLRGEGGEVSLEMAYPTIRTPAQKELHD